MEVDKRIYKEFYNALRRFEKLLKDTEVLGKKYNKFLSQIPTAESMPYTQCQTSMLTIRYVDGECTVDESTCSKILKQLTEAKHVIDRDERYVGSACVTHTIC